MTVVMGQTRTIRIAIASGGVARLLPRLLGLRAHARSNPH
jgi:hypothetical protein